MNAADIISSSEDSLPLPVVKNSFTESRPGRKRSLGLVVALVVVICSVFFVRYFYRISGSDNGTAESAIANQGIFALGRLEPEGEIISIAAPSGAGDSRIKSLKVDEGSRVKKGEILAVLDNDRRLIAAVQVAESSVAQANANLAKTIREVETTTEQLRAALVSVNARVETARTKVERYRNLVEVGGVSKDLLDDATLKFDTASAAKREAEARLARYASEHGDNNDSVDVKPSRSEVARAESLLFQAKEDLEQSFVRAPRDGRILRVNLQPGERVNQTALFELGNTANMMVRIEVYESDIITLENGQIVALSASPLVTELTGAVQSIGTLVRKQEIVDSDPAANTDARVIEVWARLDEESQKIAAKFVNLQVRAQFTP